MEYSGSEAARNNKELELDVNKIKWCGGQFSGSGPDVIRIF